MIDAMTEAPVTQPDEISLDDLSDADIDALLAAELDQGAAE
ncbi:hypothetical protein FHS89_003266 [Rubricella aquisinus]|uniref:Uncharacterized protein n=1 Tax=Rubricella aquisinus TaxID=2028108 RepID=A0A840WT88_9RHOB|nr:hypothetical protein [Rubricella aquisinus]MBB5517213.1 hypothetical protein [Rubricella aquisinus]